MSRGLLDRAVDNSNRASFPHTQFIINTLRSPLICVGRDPEFTTQAYCVAGTRFARGFFCSARGYFIAARRTATTNERRVTSVTAVRTPPGVRMQTVTTFSPGRRREEEISCCPDLTRTAVPV